MIALIAAGIYFLFVPFAWAWVHGGTGSLEPAAVLPLFGETRLWAVCLLFALPLALDLAPRFHTASLKASVLALGALGAAGLALPWLLLEALQATQALWSFTGIDMALRIIGRPLAAWIMLLPWTALARRTGFGVSGNGPLLAACVLLASIPTSLYAIRLTQLEQEKLQGQIDRNLVVPVIASTDILAQLKGWDDPAAKQHAVERIRLKKEAGQLARQAALPLSGSASARLKWERAIVWIRLGQPDRAQKILDELAPNDPVAALLSASVDRFEGRFAHARVRYAELLNPSAGTFSAEDRYAIHEGLAESLQGLGRFAELSTLWQQALVEFPEKTGPIRFNLAMAEASLGHYQQALSDLDAAQAATPSMKDQVERQRRRILANTSACFSRLQ